MTLPNASFIALVLKQKTKETPKPFGKLSSHYMALGTWRRQRVGGTGSDRISDVADKFKKCFVLVAE